MNIKSVHLNPLPAIEPKARVDGQVKTQSSTDRDANGRQESGSDEAKRHLTETELKEALEILGDHPGLKANGLAIKVEEQAGHKVILIIDPQGRTVRRLSENQLWLATRDKDRSTGRILDKAM